MPVCKIQWHTSGNRLHRLTNASFGLVGEAMVSQPGPTTLVKIGLIMEWILTVYLLNHSNFYCWFGFISPSAQQSYNVLLTDCSLVERLISVRQLKYIKFWRTHLCCTINTLNLHTSSGGMERELIYPRVVFAKFHQIKAVLCDLSLNVWVIRQKWLYHYIYLRFSAIL